MFLAVIDSAYPHTHQPDLEGFFLTAEGAAGVRSFLCWECGLVAEGPEFSPANTQKEQLFFVFFFFKANRTGIQPF